LRSYRAGGDGRWQIQFLGADARSVETIVTRTEGEALLLEDTLIKTHKPQHNVRLKDDKSFRMLRIDLSDKFPRLKFVRAKNPTSGARADARASSGRSRRAARCARRCRTCTASCRCATAPTTCWRTARGRA
jgi:excinuclease ABC subunit C